MHKNSYKNSKGKKMANTNTENPAHFERDSLPKEVILHGNEFSLRITWRDAKALSRGVSYCDKQQRTLGDPAKT